MEWQICHHCRSRIVLGPRGCMACQLEHDPDGVLEMLRECTGKRPRPVRLLLKRIWRKLWR